MYDGVGGGGLLLKPPVAGPPPVLIGGYPLGFPVRPGQGTYSSGFGVGPTRGVSR